jgi:4-amino-4-deoxy-L-arabinose transferase-like glycosyltransferase
MSPRVYVVSALVVSAVLKIWLILIDVVPFNSDEAVVALMARHILKGARPIFFYGQAYMGSLDAWIVASGFWLFGEKIWVIRLVQGFLYLLTLLTTVWLGKEVFGKWQVGIIAAWLLAIPTVNVTLYTTVTLGGYGEALLIGNLILISSFRIGKYFQVCIAVPAWLWLIWGFLTGLGLWAFGLTIVYSLPTAIYLVQSLWKRLRQGGDNSRFRLSYFIRIFLLVGFGFVLGSMPWWNYALRYGLTDLVFELSGGAIAGVEGLPWLLQIKQHFINFLILGTTVVFGLRPPWGVNWLGLPLLPFVFIFWVMVIIYISNFLRKSRPVPSEIGVLASVILILVLGFVITPFGADPTGRYFLPMAVPLALFAGMMIWDWRQKFGFLALGLVLLVVVHNIWGTAQVANQYPPGVTTQFDAITQIDHRNMDDLITFLDKHGETRGYSNYWVSYPLAFLSKEELVFVPHLPYHQDFRYTERDDRYKPYGDLVSEGSRLAYVTTNNTDLDIFLRKVFTETGVQWDEEQIGDYKVFYNLSTLVYAQDIGLDIYAP